MNKAWYMIKYDFLDVMQVILSNIETDSNMLSNCLVNCGMLHMVKSG